MLMGFIIQTVVLVLVLFQIVVWFQTFLCFMDGDYYGDRKKLLKDLIPLLFVVNMIVRVVEEWKDTKAKTNE